MGRKAFCVPALVSSFIAVVLLMLCTISTPTTFHSSTPFNFVQASDLGNITDITAGANQDRQLAGLKLGSWGYCSAGSVENSFNYCSDNHHGYNITLRPANGSDQAAYSQTMIKSSWTRGLVVIVVAFVFSIIGFALSFVPHLVVMLIASIVHFLTFVLALIAFAIQIALFVYTRNKLHDVSNTASVYPGPGFYLTLISLPLLFFSALTVCCGWRQQKKGDAAPAAYEAESGSGGRFSGLTSRFRRNRKTTENPYDDANAYDNQTSSYSNGTDKIPMQSSRQRVLDAFRSEESGTATKT